MSVYVTNYAGHDFSAAEQYGELEYVTKGNINIYRTDRDLYNLTEKLEKYDDEKDYLLLSGNILVNAMVLSVLLTKGVKKLNLLVYDAKNLNYIHHTLIIDRDKNEVKFERRKN